MSLIEMQNTYEGKYGPSIGYAQFNIKAGYFSLCAQSAWINNGSGLRELSRMFMIEKNITVPKHSNMNLSLSLAVANKQSIPTLDSKGNNLIVHEYTQMFCGGEQTWFYS